MAKKLGVSPRQINVSQQVKPDKAGELRPVPYSLPIKSAVVEADASHPPKAEEED